MRVGIRLPQYAYAEAGIQHVVAAPWRRDAGEWLGAMSDLADLVIDQPGSGT